MEDSKHKAILFMNVYALSATIQGALFKYIAKDGVSIIEFFFFRHVWIGGVAALMIFYKGKNPFVGLPRSLVKDFVIRSVSGQITFALFNLAITLLPMATAVILMQMNPFWTAILASILLGERIRPIEIIGIFVCFCGVVMIATSKEQAEPNDANS